MSAQIVLAHTTMSLDGYIAGPDHDMDWIFDSGVELEGDLTAVDEVIASTGAILSGRNGYEVGERATRDETAEAFGGAWQGPEFVLTHRPPEDPGKYTFLSGNIRAAVATCLRAADGRNLLVLGGQVVRQCLDAGVLDEILVHVHPIVLGDGIPFFPRGERHALRQLWSSQDGSYTTIRYAVAK